MNNQQSSCTVALHRGRNHATFTPDNENTNATSMQPNSLKALANKVLSRNKTCNHHATKQEKPCNFPPQKSALELHRLHLEKLLSEVGAEITEDGQGLRFKPELAGPEIDPDRWQKALELEHLFFELNL